MATIEEMLSLCGTLENAENTAKTLIAQYGDRYKMDLALLYAAQGKTADADLLIDEVLQTQPNNERALFNKAWTILRDGDLTEGYRMLRAGRKVGVYAKPDIKTTKPEWNGKDCIMGKTVLFHCECGLGDEIIHVRFVKEVLERGAKVIIGCSKPLIPIFNRIPGVSAVVDKEFDTAVYHDYWMPSMNAVDTLGISYQTLSGAPYLTARPEYVEKWSRFFKGDEFKIGIRWAGNVRYENELFRTIPARELIDAVSMPGVKVYSLQRDDDRIDLPDHVTDLGDMMPTWEDTAGIMKNLDLVISACTSVPHFAGGLGVPTWVIVPLLTYYQWAVPGYFTPWYDSVTVYRQQRFEEWREPLGEVSRAMMARICLKD